MSEQTFSLRVKKFLTNPLLQRKQFSVDVIHPNRGGVSRSNIVAEIARMYKIQDSSCIVIFGLKTGFGGGRSSGFGLIYDSLASLKKFEKKYRLVRLGLEEATQKQGRRAKKELKNRKKKVRGKEKVKVAAAGAKKK